MLTMEIIIAANKKKRLDPTDLRSSMAEVRLGSSGARDDPSMVDWTKLHADMAAANGGNCALTVPGETVVRHGVTIIGESNLTSGMPFHASQLYARTLMAMLQDFTDENGFAPNDEDEVFTGSCVTRGGQVVHERVKSLLN